MSRIINNVHDVELSMAEVLAQTAKYDSDTNDNIPSFLWSDYALDVVSINKPENLGVSFLWHVHYAGTYLHYVNLDSDMKFPTYEKWKKNFENFDDWTFTELNYRWGSNIHKHPMERIYYFDGHKFREVSRNTALLIWQYTGKEIIRKHEQLVPVAVTA